MDYWIVEVWKDADIIRCRFNESEFNDALVYFLTNHRSDRKVVFTYVGEEYDDGP